MVTLVRVSPINETLILRQEFQQILKLRNKSNWCCQNYGIQCIMEFNAAVSLQNLVTSVVRIKYIKHIQHG